jgi:hypothetical protein
MAKPPSGFIPLKTLQHGPPDARTALEEIRRIYFATTKRTIDNDLAHAIDLLKSLPDEETREKATVYMEGLSQMRREWQPAPQRPGRKPPRNRG